MIEDGSFKRKVALADLAVVVGKMMLLRGVGWGGGECA